MSKQVALVILGFIILLGVALRSYEITARSLWFDEAFSWRLIEFSWPEMIARAAADVHPPLYYIVLKGWSVVFGSSLVALRSFSVAAAAATIAAAYLFVSSAVRSRAVGLFAAALIALSGWQIQFAWEARMYTLGTTLALMSSWALLRAVRREPQTLGWWFVYALLSSLFAYVHYYALLTILAHIVFVIGYVLVLTRGRPGEILQSRRLWYGLIAAILAGALYAPWIPILVNQLRQVQAAYWIPPLGGWSVPDTFYRMSLPTAGIPRHTGIGSIALAVLPLLATVGLWFLLVKSGPRRRSSSDAAWLVLLSGVVPFLTSVGFSLVTQSLYQDRFFVFAHVFILMALALVIWRLPGRWLRGAVVALVLAAFVTAALNYWRELDISHRPGAQAATRRLFAERKTREPIVVSSPFIYFAVLHYAQEEYQSEELPRLYSETEGLAHFAGGPILTANDVVGPKIFTTASTFLWVVDTTGFGSTALRVPAPWWAIKTETYPEVFEYQGEVIVTKYVK